MAAALAVALLLPGISAPFDDPGEGQHAEIAREVIASGHWLILTLNGVPYLDKPPLLYWLDAAAFAAWGPREWPARLAPLLGTCLAAAGTAVFGARLLGPRGGLLAAGALLSCALFVAFGRYVRPETLFVAAIQWGFTGLCLGLDRARSRPAIQWSLIGCAALGAASLAKDPLGLVGPLVAVGAALALARRLRPLSSWLPPRGAALIVLIGMSWYAAAALRQPGFAWYTAVDNHLLNVARLRWFPDEDVPLSSLEFVVVSTAGALPWIIPAALATATLVRRRAWRDPDEVAWTALAIWVLGVFAVWTAAPFKLPHYALPAYPALALLAARGWQEARGSARPLIVAHLLLFALLAGAGAMVSASDGRAFLGAVLSATDVYARKEAELGQVGAAPQWSVLGPLVARTAIVFALGSVALIATTVCRARTVGQWAVLLTMLAAMPSVTAAVSHVASSRAVRGMAAEIRRELGPDDLLVHEGPIENSGALELYSGRRPILLEARRSVLGFGATLPASRETFWESRDLRRAWCGGRRILLLTPRGPDLSIAASLPPETVRLLSVRNGRWLYANAGAGTAPRRC